MFFLFSTLISYNDGPDRSGTRTPQEVFLLLESIYGAFDSISEKRGVFKVEVRLV